jgi:hypothetical protein
LQNLRIIKTKEQPTLGNKKSTKKELPLKRFIDELIIKGSTFIRKTLGEI